VGWPKAWVDAASKLIENFEQIADEFGWHAVCS
jgi:hypothetical protein